MKNVKLFVFLFILSLPLLACRATAADGGAPTIVPISTATAVSPTPIIVSETAVATTVPSATATSEPDEDSNGSSQPPGDPIPATPIASVPTAVTQVVALTGVNMRSGPGLDFVVLDWLVEGQVIQVTGTNSDQTWWEVPCGVATSGRCWITALPQYVEPVTIPDTTGAQRVQFMPGTYSTTLMDTLAAYDLHRYLLRASAGQKMLVQLNGLEKDAYLMVQGADNGIIYPDLSPHPRLVEIMLPTTQDYLIQVMSLAETTPYALDVAIISTTVDPEPIRIAFGPGENSASLAGHVSPFLPIRYLVGAAAEQIMHVALSPELEGVNFSLVGAKDGQPYKRLVNSDTVWSGKLPTTQDYILSVAVPADLIGSNYVLDVAIDSVPQLPDVPWIGHDGIEPPAHICAALNPGDLPVPVRDGPETDLPIVAFLGDWSEIVYSLLDWHQIRISGFETGWVQSEHVLIGGPCRSEGPVTTIVMIDSIGELPEEICAAHKPDEMPPVAVRSQPNDDAPLLALLFTWTAVEGYGVGDGYVKIGYGFEESGWVRSDQVLLAGDCTL